MATRITAHFTLEELTRSETASRMKIDNTPRTTAIRGNMERLARELLEPIRAAWGRPVIISSGYRCPELNRAVGGTPTSVHQLGLAADLVPEAGEDRAEFVRFVRRTLHEKGLLYDQFIDEEGWAHVGLMSNGGLRRRQDKRCRGGRYTLFTSKP